MKNSKLLSLSIALVAIGSLTTSCQKDVEVKKDVITEQCVDIINPEIVQTDSGTWQLTTNDEHLMYFPSEEEAKQTLKIIKSRDIDKHCQCGEGRWTDENGKEVYGDGSQIMEYHLLMGQTGLTSESIGEIEGEDCIDFDPTKLKVSGKTLIEDLGLFGSHLMFTFNSKEQCKQAKAIILQYGFNQTCFVGRPNPSFSYLKIK